MGALPFRATALGAVAFPVQEQQPMSRSHLFRVALITVLSAVLPTVSACSSDDTATASLDTSDVVHQGLVTDGQLRAVLSNEARDWAWAGGQFDAPEDSAVLSSETPFEFTWHADATEDIPAAGAPNDFEMMHLLIFSTPSKSNLLRVFSSLDSYTPDAAAWQTLTLAGKAEAITLSLTSATFEGDALTINGGPFIGQALTFTIE